MQIPTVRERLREMGARDCHEDRILRAWLRAHPLDQRTKRQSEHYYPVSLREGLPGLQADLDARARIRSVLLPRGGLSVSTQAGCRTKAPNCLRRQQATPTQRS